MQTAPRNPVPVFPLPNLVLFPHALAPLHVFELRYRTMVRDALSGERVIAMALLKSGWEADYEGSPEYHGLGCLARFQEVEWLPNDCYQLLVAGVGRVRIGRVTKEFPYRAARVDLLPQEPYSEDDPLVLSERDAVMRRLRALMAGSLGAGAAPAAALAGLEQASYECVVNALCTRLEVGPEEKLELLALGSVLERGRRAMELARKQRQRRRPTGPPPADPGQNN
jgi:Lon protease-like protein